MCVCVCEQMEVIKKAYQQDSEFEGGEVSPREVGHNIYILAQQVTPAPHWLPGGPTLLSLSGCSSVDTFSLLFVCLFAAGQTQQGPSEPPETSKEQQRRR